MSGAASFDDATAAAEAIHAKADVTEGVQDILAPPPEQNEPAPPVDDPRERKAAELVGRAVEQGVTELTGEEPSDVFRDATTELARLVLDLTRTIGGGVWGRFALIGGSLAIMVAPAAIAALKAYRDPTGKEEPAGA